jgi:peptidoglycan/LPS O-acetylase OafA/YrhL
MYGVVLVLGCLGLLRSQWMAVTVAAVLALSLWKIPALGSSLHLGWELVRGMLFFLAGIAAHSLRQHIKIAPAHALLFWIPVFLVPLPAREGMFYLAWIATMLAAGTHLSLARRLVLRNDYSYGVYLYGFPLQQTLVHFFPSMGAAENFLVAFPAALALAVFSWHTVESPMLRLVRRRGPGPNMSLAEQWGASSKALALAAGLPGAAVLMSVVCAAFMPLA